MATLHTAASGIIARRKICMQRGAVEKAAARSIAGVLAGCAARRNVTKIRAAAEAEAVTGRRKVQALRSATEAAAPTTCKAFVAGGNIGPVLSGRFYGQLLLEVVTMETQAAPMSPAVCASPKLGRGLLLEVVSMESQARPPSQEQPHPFMLKDLDTGREVDLLDAAAVQELVGAKSGSTGFCRERKGPGFAGTLEQVVEAARRQAAEELELSLEVLAHPPSNACVQLWSILRLILILPIGSGALCGE
jgi:hypothetical protein